MAFERNMTNFLKVARRMVDSSDLLGTILIVNEARKTLELDSKGLTDYSNIMYAIYEASRKLELPIKMFNERIFCELIELMPDNLDWAKIYEELAGYSSGIVILPKVLKNNFYIPEDAKHILVVEGEKFIGFIKDIVNEHMNSEFIITTYNKEATCVLRNIFPGASSGDFWRDRTNYKEIDYCIENEIILYTNVTIVVQEESKFGRYDSSDNNTKFDSILSFPPIRRKDLPEDRARYSEWICQESDAIALQHLPTFLNEDGFLNILMPCRIQFSGNRFLFLRSYIQEKFNVKKINEMPSGIIKGTGIKFVMIQLQKNNQKNQVELTDYKPIVISKFNDNLNSLEIQNQISVDYNEFVSAQSWQIGRFVTYEDDEIAKFHKSKIARQKIGEVAEVFRGRSINLQEKGNDDGEYSVINVSNIGDYRVNFNDLVKIDDSGSTVTKYILKSGDILIPARGTAIRAAVFEEQDFKCIASSNIIVIRPKSKRINSTYLKAFLGSPLGKRLVENNQIGGTLININYKELASMEIPCPDLTIQNEVADKFKSGLKEYEEVTRAANEKWDSVLNGIYNEWS